MLLSLSSMAQDINLKDGKYHILTEDMIKPFKTKASQLFTIIVTPPEPVKINLHLIKTERIDYHMEKNHYDKNFYYNPITTKL